MSVFANELKNVTEDQAEVLKEYFEGYDYRGAGYTYIANYIWRTSYCVSWEIIEGYLCLAGTNCSAEDGNAFMAMPLTKTGYEPESLRKAIEICMERFREAGKPFILTSIPGHLVEVIKAAFDGEVEFVHEEDYDEYVYLKEKLIELSGRALHKKKNHLNYFLRNYEYEAKTIDKSMKPDIMALTESIKEFKSQDENEIEDLEGEYEAIAQIIDMVEDPKIYGVGIYIKGKLEAFAIGEQISDTLAAEHFEKANDSYRGLYQLVCREFCKLLPESVEYVNREEDMGLPNLRQAKEALKPDHMEKRFTAVFGSC